VYPLRAVHALSVALQTLISSNVAELLAVPCPFASRHGLGLPFSLFASVVIIHLFLFINDTDPAALDCEVNNPAALGTELVHNLAG
jgi:hypothetical protein